MAARACGAASWRTAARPPERDLRAWSEWTGHGHADRPVAEAEIHDPVSGRVEVSAVDFGLGRNLSGHDPPLLFETIAKHGLDHARVARMISEDRQGEDAVRS